MKKGTKKLIYVIVIVLLVAGVTLIGKYCGNGQDEIDKTVHKYAPTGSSIALIENGEIVEIRNYGYADKENRQPVTDETRFKIASISKAVTSYGVMQLVEQGVLDLDTPVNQYLTRWQLPESEYGEDKVTLRMLMSHTAGVTGSNEYGYEEPLPTIDEALRMHHVSLKREPGVQFEYSEFVGHGICQLVIEEVTGMTFEDYMVNEIFEPLGMIQTDYANTTNEKGELAVPYAGVGKRANVVPIVMNGAGGVTTTSHDLALFELALMDYYVNGCGEMFKEQEHTQSPGGTYCFGIIPRYLSDGRVVYEHNGTLTGWNAQLVIEPESRNGIAVVTNDDKAYYLTYELMEVWSKKVLGETVSDPMMKQMQNVFRIFTTGLLVIAMIFGMILLRNARKHRYKWKTGPLKIGVCTFVYFLLVGIDYIIFYTDLLGKSLWGMEQYYMFSFFPPSFQLIQLIVGIIGLMMVVRVNLVRIALPMKGNDYKNAESTDCR